MTAGVRYERLNNPDNPILNPNDVRANGSYALDAQIPDQNNKWSPRAGITFAPDPKTAVRLSLGRFWARTPGILFSQLITSNGLVATQYTINAGGTAANRLAPTDPLSPGWGPNFNPNGVEPINFQAVPTPTGLGVFTADPNYKDPVTDRVTLGVDREIISGTVVGIEGTYAKAKNLERLNDPNLVLDGSVSAVNGQPRYSTVRPDPFYGRISTYTTDASSKYEAVTFNMQHRFTKDLQFFLVGDLVRGQGQRLERAQLRRRAGGGPPQPRRQLQLGQPRPALEARRQRELEHAVVGHRPLGHVPLHERLALHGDDRRGREPGRILQRPSHDQRRALLPQPVPAAESSRSSTSASRRPSTSDPSA